MEKADDVSNIHNRFSLTLINPSSHYFSLVASLIIAVVITATTHLGYLSSDDFLWRIPLVVGVLAISQLIDTRFTKKKEYSKSLHASLFANMLWQNLSPQRNATSVSKRSITVFCYIWNVSICKF